MKYYLNLFKIRIITNLQYRADAIAGLSTQIFFGLIFIMVYFAFYKYGNTSNIGMNWNEMVTYLWLQQATLSIIFSFVKNNELLNIIKNGNICYELIKPQNFFIKTLIKAIAKAYISSFLKFMPLIIVAFLLPNPYKLSLPASSANFILFILGILVSGILNCTLITIVHLLVVFTIDSRGLFAIYSTISDFFKGGLIPLPLLPISIQKISSYLPFRYIEDFPLRVYSNNITVNEGWLLLFYASLWTIIMIIIGLLINKIIMRKAVVNGG